jgi:hypothetical protein
MERRHLLPWIFWVAGLAAQRNRTDGELADSATTEEEDRLFRLFEPTTYYAVQW